MKFVWQVQTNGGDPAAIKAAIERGITHLRNGDPVPDLHPDELEPWETDIATVDVGEPAVDGDRRSVLVDIDSFTNRESRGHFTAAVLSGGFDTVVLDYVMQVDGVITGTHSDRIARPNSGLVKG